MLPVIVKSNRLHIGKHFSVSFQRTLRIPDDGSEYPLPPGLGNFPILKVSDYADRVPESWKEHGGVFIPMYQREAMWLSFEGADWHPNAVKVGLGKVNALSGKPWDQTLGRGEQDYCVVPDQPWLDGINAGKGFIRQFVAMPLGLGYTVEGQLTGKEEFGGIQLIVYEPKPGKFSENPPSEPEPTICFMLQCNPSAEMGLGAGGRMRQKIYPDSHGLETWDEYNYGRVYIHIVNSMIYREITGMEPPSTPVSAREYTTFGLPWFGLYDEHKGDIAPSEELAGVKSVKELEGKKATLSQQDDGTVGVPENQVKILKLMKGMVEDGKW